MEEQEKWLARTAVQPFLCRFGDLLAPPLYVTRIARLDVASIERTVVGIESLVEAEAPIEDKPSDERPGVISAGLENSCKRGCPGDRWSPLS